MLFFVILKRRFQLNLHGLFGVIQPRIFLIIINTRIFLEFCLESRILFRIVCRHYIQRIFIYKKHILILFFVLFVSAGDFFIIIIISSWFSSSFHHHHHFFSYFDCLFYFHCFILCVSVFVVCLGGWKQTNVPTTIIKW